jgi:RNA polymerase sigma-70 factor (ECF subfamily)
VQIIDHTFDDWVRQYQRLLFGIAYWWTGSRTDAEELTQEAFFQAYRSRSTLREVEAVKRWLISILRHCYAQMSRKSNSRAEVPLDGMENEPEEQDMLSADVLALHQSLAKLDDRHRLSLVMFYYFQQLSYQEISEALELPIGTVMSRLSQARKMLHETPRNSTEPDCYEEGEGTMNCELYKSEMYAWRPGSDAVSFQPLFDHLAGCPECAQFF